MPRRPNIERPIRVHIVLPEALWGRLTLHLYSSLENRVPHGAYSEFFAKQLEEFFSTLEPPNAQYPKS